MEHTIIASLKYLDSSKNIQQYLLSFMDKELHNPSGYLQWDLRLQLILSSQTCW